MVGKNGFFSKKVVKAPERVCLRETVEEKNDKSFFLQQNGHYLLLQVVDSPFGKSNCLKCLYPLDAHGIFYA
jgi:hypothetical protein